MPAVGRITDGYRNATTRTACRGAKDERARHAVAVTIHGEGDGRIVDALRDELHGGTLYTDLHMC
jgi:hypothetical protein